MTEKSEEVCESCELHENLLKIVKEMMPEETELYDLAELFEYDTVSHFSSASDFKTK